MPTYLYACPDCNREETVIKPISQYKDKESCPDCQGTLEQVFENSGENRFNIKSYGYYNSGIGTYVKNKDSIKDRLAEIKDSTGRDIVEMGNEKVEVTKKKDNFEAAGKAMYQELQRINPNG